MLMYTYIVIYYNTYLLIYREAVPVPTSTPVVVPPPNVLPSDLPMEILIQMQRLKSLADLFFASHTGKLSGPEVNEIILA